MSEFTMTLHPVKGSPYQLDGESINDLIHAANQDDFKFYYIEDSNGEIVYELGESSKSAENIVLKESDLPCWLRRQAS